MKYQCTRNRLAGISAAQAIAQGISRDGGLFVPESLPQYDSNTLMLLSNLTYRKRAAYILKDFLSDFSEEEILDCVEKAYGGDKFSGGHPAPLTDVKKDGQDLHLLELWHGPTCAFKDMALQLLPHLLTKSLKKIQSDKTAVILVATSGDTGKAALEGFKDVEGTKILVFYPQDGVSSMQKRQMNTQEGENVSVCAIEGNFDDAQTGVKKIFTNQELLHKMEENGYLFSSANSINWGRLLPQIVYYFSAYGDLLASGKLKDAQQEINITVPTGNFGNILAAYYAKKMGLPVHKLICASNSNNVLTDFLRTGVYNRNRHFFTTISPSMDILISSNLERLLYDLSGSSEKTAGWMKELAETGCYKVDDAVFQQIQALFYAGCCDDKQTEETIHSVYQADEYVCDTHTAVAVNVYEQYLKETKDVQTPAVIVSTASPYKFTDSVLEAISGKKPEGDDFDRVENLEKLTSLPIPAPIEALRAKEVRFRTVCTKDKMPQAVLTVCGIEQAGL